MEESHWNEDGTHTHCCNCNHTEGIKRTFKIPIEKISDFNPKWWEFWHWGKKKISAKEQAQKSLSELMGLYKGDILWDETIGELKFDKKLPIPKDMCIDTKKEDK